VIVEAGLICIFIELRILNEARVSSYIQAILSHEETSIKEKRFKCVILVIQDEFKG